MFSWMSQTSLLPETVVEKVKSVLHSCTWTTAWPSPATVKSLPTGWRVNESLPFKIVSTVLFLLVCKGLMVCGKPPLLFVYSPTIITFVHYPSLYVLIMPSWGWGREQRGLDREKQQRSEGEKHLREKEKYKERLLCWERCLELHWK